MGTSNLREQVFALIYAQNKPEQAILQLNRIIKQTPERSEALALKAYALNKLANSRQEWKYSSSAMEYANRALALNPNDDIALTSKGWALIDLRQPEDALTVLEQATRVNSENEYAWYNLAWAQYLTGNAVASKASIMRALKISPGNAIIKRGRDMMEKGKIPSRLKRIAQDSRALP
jgi:tetratricopeptide (TPR) repeat protein